MTKLSKFQIKCSPIEKLTVGRRAQHKDLLRGVGSLYGALLLPVELGMKDGCQYSCHKWLERTRTLWDFVPIAGNLCQILETEICHI